MINAAIAVFYYLSVVRESWFRDPGDLPPIRLDGPTRVLCLLLIGGILALGIAPSPVLDRLRQGVAQATHLTPAPAVAVVGQTR
jgi:NADH-quinone oxidoreductase subunit N